MNFYTTIFDLLSSLGLDNGIYGYTLCSFVSTALSYKKQRKQSDNIRQSSRNKRA